VKTFRRAIADGARRLRCAAERGAPPVTDRPARDPGLALDLAIVQATGDERRDPITLLNRTHVPMMPAGADDARGGIRTRMPLRTIAFEAIL
jgi:hypothetical protein